MTDENSRLRSNKYDDAAVADNSTNTATRANANYEEDKEDGRIIGGGGGICTTTATITGLASRMVDMALESDSLGRCLGGVAGTGGGSVSGSGSTSSGASAASSTTSSSASDDHEKEEGGLPHDVVEVERTRTDHNHNLNLVVGPTSAATATATGDPPLEPPIPATAASVDVDVSIDDDNVADAADGNVAASASVEAASASTSNPPSASSSTRSRGPRLRVPRNLLKRNSTNNGGGGGGGGGGGSNRLLGLPKRTNTCSPTNASSLTRDKERVEVEVTQEEEAKEGGPSPSEVERYDNVISDIADAAATTSSGPLLAATDTISSTAAAAAAATVQVPQTGGRTLGAEVQGQQPMYMYDTKEDHDDGDDDEEEGLVEVVGEEGIAVTILPPMITLAGGGGEDGGGHHAPIVTRTVTTKTTKTVRHRETAVHHGQAAHTTETVNTERSARATTTFPSGADRAAAVLSSSSAGGGGDGDGDGSSKKDKNQRPDPPSDALQSFMIADDGGKSADVRMSDVPSEEERSKAWGTDRVAFAQRCTLERYDDEKEKGKEDEFDHHQVKQSDSNDGCAISATAASASPKKSKRRSGIGSMRRSSPTSSTTAARVASPKKELPGHPVPSTSWGPTSATKFKTRVGPNYAKYGKKEPSQEALYETVCVRMFTSGRRTENIVDVMPLPLQEAFGGGGGGDTGGDGKDGPGLLSPWGDHGDLMVEPSVPDLLVYHVQMPHDAPSMFKPAEDGKGEEAVVYLRPSRRFVDEMTGKKPMSPAAKLFAKWCKTCDTDFAVRSRFKCMALVRNLEAHNLGWVSPYNGKPVLITESGHARKGVKDGVRYVEMTANVHKWGFLAKKGFVSLLPKFKELRLDIGFTIEAQSDHEMPECMLGAFTANFCDEDKLTAISNDLQKPAA